MTTEEVDSASTKAFLSQLYVTWVTSPEGEEGISRIIRELLDSAHQTTTASSSSPSAAAIKTPPADLSLLQEPTAAPLRKTSPRSDQLHSSASNTSGDAGPKNFNVKTTHFVRSPTRETSPVSPRGSHRLHVGRRESSLVDTSGASHVSTSLSDIPSFYSKNVSQGFLPSPDHEERMLLDELLSKFKSAAVTKKAFSSISSLVFKIPTWMRDLLFDRIVERTGGQAAPEQLTCTQIHDFYTNVCANQSQSRRLFEIIKGDDTRDYLSLEDLKGMTRYLVAVHGGLQFLKQPEFQEYYCRTVAIRIMYCLEHQQANKIYWNNFCRSSLPDVTHELDSTDVNEVLEYFSYEHFYVLYCRFWELDTDRDLHLTYFDMCNYGQGMLTPLVVERVVNGFGRPLSSGTKKCLDYEDFIYFCLSEEDKNSPAAIYYWFKVLDLDADGILSGYELNFFVEQNNLRLAECFDSEKSPLYDDMLCQMLDMLGVDSQRLLHNGGLTLADLRGCPTPSNFFNMIFNASKFCLFEERDPFSAMHQMRSPEKTDWDRFARAEYDRMSAESQ